MTGGDRSAADESYKAWMLRMWRVESEAGPAWHASLQRVGTEERCGFDDVEQLVAFLRRQAGRPGSPEGQER
ncbi:MAG: hypothetical protein R6X16_00840 [Anaerolineae bacterium]